MCSPRAGRTLGSGANAPRSGPRTAEFRHEIRVRDRRAKTLRGMTGAFGDEVVHRMGVVGRAGAAARRRPMRRCSAPNRVSAFGGPTAKRPIAAARITRRRRRKRPLRRLDMATDTAAALVPPQEVYTVIRESRFSPLGIPRQRGFVYTIAVIDRGGEDGRLVIDARTGRIIRFMPAWQDGRPLRWSAGIRPMARPARCRRQPSAASRGRRPRCPASQAARVPVPKPSAARMQTRRPRPPSPLRRPPPGRRQSRRRSKLRSRRRSRPTPAG